MVGDKGVEAEAIEGAVEVATITLPTPTIIIVKVNNRELRTTLAAISLTRRAPSTRISRPALDGRARSTGRKGGALRIVVTL